MNKILVGPSDTEKGQDSSGKRVTGGSKHCHIAQPDEKTTKPRTKTTQAHDKMIQARDKTTLPGDTVKRQYNTLRATHEHTTSHNTHGTHQWEPFSVTFVWIRAKGNRAFDSACLASLSHKIHSVSMEWATMLIVHVGVHHRPMMIKQKTDKRNG